MSMTQDELNEFLQEPRLARLATVNEDGSPQVTPVWTEYDGEVFHFITRRTTVKAQNIERDNRVAFTVDTDKPPYRAVVVWGHAEWQPELTEELTRRLSVRYLGEEKGEEFAQSVLSQEGRTAFLVRPYRVVSWDGSK